MRVSFVSATPPGLEHPESLGMFFDDEMALKKGRDQWLSFEISSKPTKNCPEEYDSEGELIPNECAFSCYGFNWNYEDTLVINCRCSNYYEDLSKLRERKLCYCKRMEEAGYSSIDPEEGVVNDIPWDLLNNGVMDIPEKGFKKADFSIKITNDEILQAIPWAHKFIHFLSYNIDKYFVGILQTLAVKGVEVSAIVSPATLSRRGARELLDAESYSRRNFKVKVNDKNHAKRAFMDGYLDLDLESINLSFNALYYNNENEASLSYASFERAPRKWKIMQQTHEKKFVDYWNGGTPLSDYCQRKWPDMFKEWTQDVSRRQKLNAIVFESREIQERSDSTPKH